MRIHVYYLIGLRFITSSKILLNVPPYWKSSELRVPFTIVITAPREIFALCFVWCL